MRVQETIEFFKKNVDKFLCKADEVTAAFNVTMWALAKQIPKKPIEKPTRGLFSDIRCPDCKALIARHQKFCKECGQALDWSDD